MSLSSLLYPWGRTPHGEGIQYIGTEGREGVSEKGDAFPGSPVSRECGQCVLLSPNITVQV